MRAALIAVLVLIGCHRNEPQRLLIFAAASLTDALEAVADAFEVAFPGVQVIISVGPSSMLARQIQQGAPADVFVAADPEWTRMLESQDLVDISSDFVLTNKLAIVGPSNSPRISTLDDLVGYGRIALADPSHVPAGVYARLSLECAGLWPKLEGQMIPTLDVRAAAVAVTSGSADLAIVYASDILLEPELFVLLLWPKACEPDIAYAASIVRQSSNYSAAEAFVSFAGSAAADTLWKQYGFGR